MKKLLFVFLVLSAVFTSCKKDDPEPPIADFSYQVIGSFSPCKVEFNTTTIGTTYSWSFNGGIGSTSGNNTSATFDNPGTYQVTLSVSGSGGVSQITKSVVIPQKATQMKINSIILTNYPMLKSNGGGWDTFPSSGPDIYFNILGPNPNNSIIYSFNNPFQDISSVKNLQFTISNGFTISIINDSYFIDVLDSDGALNSDELGYISFNPSVYTILPNNYPSSFERTQNGITAIFNVTWK